MTLRSILAAIAIAALTPAVASARTVHFSISEHGTSTGPPKYIVVSSKCNVLKSTWGKGNCASRTTPPKTTGYWKFKGGTIYYTFTTSLKGTKATGTGKFRRGTGKFKGIKGSFKVSGDIITGKFHESGTATY
jgi:hypothetical protein